MLIIFAICVSTYTTGFSESGLAVHPVVADFTQAFDIPTLF